MLPQSAALEGLVADKLGGRTKRARPGLSPTRHSTFPRGDSELPNRNVTRESGEKVTSPMQKATHAFGLAQKVFVLDKKKRPLMPTHPARARLLLKTGRAVVHKRVPFTIRLKDRDGGAVQPVRMKIAPSRATTGIAIIREYGNVAEVLHLAVLHHKPDVRKAMAQRYNYRSRRRRVNLRYRPPRLNNEFRIQRITQLI